MEVLKLLLLGTGESGKSTLFKQVIQLYGKGFSDEARAPYASIVYANTIASMKTLILQADRLSGTYDTAYAADLNEAAKFVNELKLEDEVDATTAAHIKRLWSDPGIQKTYTKRAMFQLTDACQWFFDRLDAIGQVSVHTDMCARVSYVLCSCVLCLVVCVFLHVLIVVSHVIPCAGKLSALVRRYPPVSCTDDGYRGDIIHTRRYDVDMAGGGGLATGGHMCSSGVVVLGTWMSL